LFSLIGFNWDIHAFTVSIPESKRNEITDKLIKFINQNSIELKELESIKGQLTWVSAIIQSATCYSSLCWKSEAKHQTLTKNFSHKSRIHHKINLSTEPLLLEAFIWFKNILLTWAGTSYLRHLNWEYAQDELLGCASDASKVGGAFTTPTRYGWYIWCPCCIKQIKHDMTTFELAAILIGLYTVIAGTLTTKRILWITDNDASATDYAKGYSSHCPVRSSIIKEIHQIAVLHNLDLKLQWITRKSLKCADILTRGSDTDFLNMPNETRKYIHPYSSQSLILMNGHTKQKGIPAMMCFAHFHPEINC
jgi:hypothetical protein